MTSRFAKKLITFIVLATVLMNPMQAMAQDNMSSNVLDESLADLSIVLGAGGVGAVLGLSTLSFVDTPKDHLKNIAIGGALGIVAGVAYVVFWQATKSQSSINGARAEILDANAVESLARVDFSKQKIAENYLLPASVGYNFSF